MSEDYTGWMSQEIKKLIDLIANQALHNNPDGFNKQLAEVQRGVEYGTNNPGSIDDLLLKIGRQFIDSLQVYMRRMRRPSTGIPPGGQATILTGGGALDTPDESASSDQFSVDELKGAIASRKKDKIEKKMKGSLDLLREYEES